ncbi:MAG: hypothetical protein AB4911_19460 [Oscillochloridaceae bacterium umkhey_bin13]
MTRYYLSIHLLSDATFGRGDGTAGLVDTEIEHDQYGLPFVGGRVIKGLLVEEYANLRFALGGDGAWDAVATVLFGQIGAAADKTAQMRVGTATLPSDLCAWLRTEQLPPTKVLDACTGIRRQTALNAETGGPEEKSLRAMRVLLRETVLLAPLDFTLPAPPDQRTLGLLAACVLAVRRGGTARNRGRGRLRMLLHEQEPVHDYPSAFTEQCFQHFAREVPQ